ncbi:MAG: hypothetical protein QOJ54_294 [Aliidongia sp.]|nr:hypothetical protein [Aliidongia sp.]
MSIQNIGASAPPITLKPLEQKSDLPAAAAVPQIAAKAANAPPAVANTAPAAAKPADLSLKVNADGTTGPHHKPRHPKLPGSFHV